MKISESMSLALPPSVGIRMENMEDAEVLAAWDAEIAEAEAEFGKDTLDGLEARLMDWLRRSHLLD